VVCISTGKNLCKVVVIAETAFEVNVSVVYIIPTLTFAS